MIYSFILLFLLAGNWFWPVNGRFYRFFAGMGRQKSPRFGLKLGQVEKKPFGDQVALSCATGGVRDRRLISKKYRMSELQHHDLTSLCIHDNLAPVARARLAGGLRLPGANYFM
jgi:hypothetical protein